MLTTVQSHLQQVYDIDVPYRVEHFLITDPKVAAALGATPDQSTEQLLVLQEGDSLSMSLFLDQDLLSGKPLRMNQYATVVEGVSHFLYMAWRAQHDHSVTQLELELQAEVDKFFSLLRERASGPRRIHRRLFSNVRYSDGLSHEQLERYRTANRLAARICEGWLKRYGEQPDHPGWLADARRFYRMDQTEKMRWQAG